jgi:hypothetical protein
MRARVNAEHAWATAADDREEFVSDALSGPVLGLSFRPALFATSIAVRAALTMICQSILIASDRHLTRHLVTTGSTRRSNPSRRCAVLRWQLMLDE